MEVPCFKCQHIIIRHSKIKIIWNHFMKFIAITLLWNSVAEKSIDCCWKTVQRGAVGGSVIPYPLFFFQFIPYPLFFFKFIPYPLFFSNLSLIPYFFSNLSLIPYGIFSIYPLSLMATAPLSSECCCLSKNYANS